MYCPRCTEERGTRSRFCVACGGPLEARPREALERDLQQHHFLLDAVERWEKSGELPAKFATRLVVPYRARVVHLEAALRELDAPAPRPDPVPPRFAQVEARVVPPAPVVLEAVASDLQPIQAKREPLPASVEPLPRNELVEKRDAPEPAAVEVAADAVALSTSLVDGPAAMVELAPPPPSRVEKIVERESSWSKVWKPFLYDNAVWFVGAFCIVSGSLYVASQAYAHVGDVARALIVFGMMLAYAAGFGAAGWLLDARKQLPSAGRILGLIGAAIGPVALVTLEPLRLHAPVAFAASSVLGVAGATWLAKLGCDRFDARISLRVAAGALVLLAWELLVPAAAGEPGLCALVPLAALFASTGLLKPRQPALERDAQAFGALGLLYLAGFDLVRLHLFALPQPGLELYGPVVAALGWIGMRADRARLGEAERPRVPATTIVALSILLVGALGALAAESSAAAAAMIATLALIDCARTYKRAAFVALATVLGLFAYYLSPDLIPHGVQVLLAAARRALGYAPGAPLPVAYAGVSTVPYLLALGVVARGARSRGLAWIYRPVAWSGAGLLVLLTLVSHSSLEVRPGLWSSLALTALLVAALWLADHAAAGYLFGYVVALLGYDLARQFDPQVESMALFVLGAAAALLVFSRIAPARQRNGLCGEALLLALVAPLAALSSSGRIAQLELAASAVLLGLIAFETRSRLPAFAGALALAGSTLALDSVSLGGLPLLAGAIACVLAAGLAWRAPERAEPGARPFGFALPLSAKGYALFQDPLALLGGALALIGLFAPMLDLLDEAGASTGFAVARCALAAAAALLLARRYAFGWGNLAAVALGALACSRWIPALAVYGLAMACLAVALERWPAFARIALRSEGSAASAPFAFGALLIPIVVAQGDAPLWLAASALGIVLLLRWRPVAWLWLPLAAGCAWWAPAPLHRQPGLVEGVLALGLAFIGLIAARRRAWAEALLGTSESVATTSGALVVAFTLVASVEPFALDLGATPSTTQATFALAGFAAAWLLLAHQTGSAIPLFVASAFAIAAVDVNAWKFFGRVHLVEALALAVLANLVRVFTSLAEPVFGARPARRSGYAFALLALLSLGLASVDLVDAHGAWHLALPYAAALVVFLSARALGWAVLQPVAMGLALLDLYGHEGASARAAVYAGAAGALAVSIATRRWPSALTLVFLDRAPDRGRAITLRVSMLVGMVLALCGAAWLSVDLQHAAFAMAVAGIAAVLFAAVLAAPSPAWWIAATLVALAGALEHSDNRDFLATFAVLNGVLALAGVLRIRAVADAFRSLLAATDAEGRRPATIRPYASALSLTAAWVLLLPGLGMLSALADRIDLRSHIHPGAQQVALLLAPTALHLLWRRRGLASIALVFGLLPLSAAYLAPPELRAVVVAACALPYALLAWRVPNRADGRLLTRIGLAMPLRRRALAGSLLFSYTVVLGCAAAIATGLDLGAWQTPATAGVVTVAFAIASLRNRSGRVLTLALLPATAHLALAWLGIQLSTGRPQVAILGGWALASALLAVAAERFAGRAEKRLDVLVAAHLYFVLGALELGGAMALMPGMRPGELLFAGLAAALLGTFATLRALETSNEAYAYLAQAALLALYLLVRLQTEWIGANADRDALSSVLLGFAFLGLHALARRAEVEVFERPTRVTTHVLPLVGLLFLPQLSMQQTALYAIGLALHFAAVSATTGGSKLAATLSAIALNAALAVTWIGRGIDDPQFYAIPFGITLLGFARIFRDELYAESRFWLRSAGILTVYVASMASTFIYANPTYVLVCAVVCVLGVLLGVMLRVRSYVYLGSAALMVDVLGNMVRYSLHQRLLLGVMLTLMGFALVGGWVFFLSKREELLRRYAAIQALMREWE